MLASGGENRPGLGLHYKWVFLLFGLLGIGWAALFYRWFRNHPKDHPSVNAAELAHIGTTAQVGSHAMPWGRLVTSRTVWLLWLQYFFLSYACIFISRGFHLPEGTVPALTEMQRAGFAGVPLLFGGLGSIIAGLASARLDRWLGSVALTRRCLGVCGMGGAGVMLLIPCNSANRCSLCWRLGWPACATTSPCPVHGARA